MSKSWMADEDEPLTLPEIEEEHCSAGSFWRRYGDLQEIESISKKLVYVSLYIYMIYLFK